MIYSPLHHLLWLFGNSSDCLRGRLRVCSDLITSDTSGIFSASRYSENYKNHLFSVRSEACNPLFLSDILSVSASYFTYFHIYSSDHQLHPSRFLPAPTSTVEPSTGPSFFHGQQDLQARYSRRKRMHYTEPITASRPIKEVRLSPLEERTLTVFICFPFTLNHVLGVVQSSSADTCSTWEASPFCLPLHFAALVAGLYQ